MSIKGLRNMWHNLIGQLPTIQFMIKYVRLGNTVTQEMLDNFAANNFRKWFRRAERAYIIIAKSQNNSMYI